MAAERVEISAFRRSKRVEQQRGGGGGVWGRGSECIRKRSGRANRLGKEKEEKKRSSANVIVILL